MIKLSIVGQPNSTRRIIRSCHCVKSRISRAISGARTSRRSRNRRTSTTLRDSWSRQRTFSLPSQTKSSSPGRSRSLKRPSNDSSLSLRTSYNSLIQRNKNSNSSESLKSFNGLLRKSLFSEIKHLEKILSLKSKVFRATQSIRWVIPRSQLSTTAPFNKRKRMFAREK